MAQCTTRGVPVTLSLWCSVIVCLQDDGCTAVILASAKGHTEAVRLLAAHGANLDLATVRSRQRLPEGCLRFLSLYNQQ